MAQETQRCSIASTHFEGEDDDVSPENVPLPTDSMITVRLSDAHSQGRPEMLRQSSEDFFVTSTVDHQIQQEGSPSSIVSRVSSRRSNRSSSSSSVTNSVDWEGLEQTEEQEARDEATDESTALLLARLEQENDALATDPKSAITKQTAHIDPRPMSVHGLKKLVNGPQPQSLRYSLLPAPAMTELEFWAALVQDYRQTVQRLPTLTLNKIRGGVPPPLRGVVWPSIAGAHDPYLHAEFARLSIETSPYDGLIGKDVGRSFPNVEMFKEKDGEGQQMLRRVLKAFSLYDDKIGYCQGLGFVVGPLLMHMGEHEAFAVLVRLMDHYDLRACYTPDLAGLHLRIYQFTHLLNKHLPELSSHLHKLNVEPLYISQWFLSFFAVTCPLPMLLRIYDIILAEGATETLMRVALSLMQRNQKKLLAFTEFEDAMQFLLSRSLWDTYAQYADDMVTDFTSLTNLVSRESLQTLEAEFKQSQITIAPSPLKSAAAALLGRFWAGANHQQSKSNLSLKIPSDNAVTIMTLRKTTSGNSLTSTMTSIDTTSSDASTAMTEVTDVERAKSEVLSLASSDAGATSMSNSSDRSLHGQIEDLLTALSKLQHQQMELARELQQEREEREEERLLAHSLLEELRKQRGLSAFEEGSTRNGDEVEDLIVKATEHFSPSQSRRISIIQTKHQLRDAATEWKEKHELEAARCLDLMRQLDQRENEHNKLREELREARQRIQDSHKDRQRLERTMSGIRRSSPAPESPADVYTPVSEKGDFDLKMPAPTRGLREFRLGRGSDVTPRSSSAPFTKRTSSLMSQSVVAAPAPAETTQSNEALLLELVNAKTAEAVARQELEETRGKLDALRKILSGGPASPAPRSADTLAVTTPPQAKTPEPQKPAHAASSSVGGFFSGWGKRS